MTNGQHGISDALAVPRSKMPPRFQELGRFLIAGLVNTLAGFLLFLLFFNTFGWHYLLSSISVFLCWAWFGFQLQKKWTFRVKPSRGSFSRYLVHRIAFFAFGTSLLWAVVEFGSLRPEVAYGLTLGVITIGMYLSSRLWVFYESQSHR